ncbi:hypothetical protein OKJ48_30820 [Streptomyces kunmingensis]|uniref:Tat pathway signal sequence domain protein n=1 Tax=Streptomyces kunmingensis TaxID=68225 RepID=A0ABU6CJN1_9ACTN|nr:hypothetical protein [Streptomyces kunmingensis]MEB3964590.1 hypothetical protein [Streptomyces kunmingensis]
MRMPKLLPLALATAVLTGAAPLALAAASPVTVAPAAVDPVVRPQPDGMSRPSDAPAPVRGNA